MKRKPKLSPLAEQKARWQRAMDTYRQGDNRYGEYGRRTLEILKDAEAQMARMGDTSCADLRSRLTY